jgi:hypothetical protein
VQRYGFLLDGEIKSGDIFLKMPFFMVFVWGKDPLRLSLLRERGKRAHRKHRYSQKGFGWAGCSASICSKLSFHVLFKQA